MTKLLLDGDVLAYQCAQFHEVALEVEPGYWTWHCEFAKVVESIDFFINSYKKRLNADQVVLCLTDYEDNFRKHIYKDYKSKRLGIKKPLVLKPTRELLLEKHGALIYPGLEGDDVMGILQTIDDEDTIIVSIDKDMKTIPGRFYNPNTDDVLRISEDEANYWHLYQTLIGDGVDGYPGLKGVGPVAATRLLDENSSWKTVVTAFRKKGYNEEFALTQARCARILRASDYDHEKKEPILWEPK